ncbi:GNAT family N-acetyltransferase [Leucobacter sp. OH1287]|uniref:GNAT family N-acetyltransferase n=1 Tax=Leucobacter sp. OH1287 TaxID=2491049 RepID=UPI000F5F2004|nr:GNAT family N-acetyltransferase [Leucobacter sp. OH1287]RRD59588.1 GNAT family N-acetyltransferase [Leucobacter sp. OH1287]
MKDHAAPKFRIRLAQPADFAAVDRLVDAAYDSAYGPRDTSWDKHRTAESRYDTGNHIWVTEQTWPAEEAGKIVATITSRAWGNPAMHDEVTDPHEMDLRLLASDPKVKGQGLGTQLMWHVIHEAKAQGFRSLVLWTNGKWEGPQRLYHRMGFVHERDRDKNDYGENGELLLHLPCFVYYVQR